MYLSIFLCMPVAEQLAIVSSWCGVEVAAVPFDKYPTGATAIVFGVRS